MNSPWFANGAVLVATEPEARMIPENDGRPPQAMCRMRVTSRKSNRRPNDQEDSDFWTVVCFGSTAEFVSNYVAKGDMCHISATLQRSAYKNGRGEWVNDVEFRATNVQQLRRPFSGEIAAFLKKVESALTSHAGLAPFAGAVMGILQAIAAPQSRDRHNAPAPAVGTVGTSIQMPAGPPAAPPQSGEGVDDPLAEATALG